MKSALLAAVFSAAMAAAAFASPARLTNNQLDLVTAGISLSLPIIIVPEPVGPTPGPVGPPTPAPWSPSFPSLPVFNPGGPVVNPGGPIVNPGGPILISCTVGVGCTTRVY
jgi:hypothetical protein